MVRLRPDVFAFVVVFALGSVSGCLVAEDGPDKAADAAWSLDCPAPCMNAIGDPTLPAWEPSVAVDPLDPAHIVVGRNAMTTDSVTGTVMMKLFAHVSHDGGATWETARLPTGPEAGRDHPMARMTGGGDPSVAFLPDGTVLFAGLFQTYFNGVLVTGATGYSTFVYRSPDGGMSWPEVSVVEPGNGALIFTPTGSQPVMWDANDKPWIGVAGDGSVLMAWTNIHSGRCDLVYSLSSDGGRTWGAQRLLDEGGCWAGAMPVATIDGTWHIAYFGYGTGELRLATSRDGATTWEHQQVGTSVFMLSFARQVMPDGHERLLLAFPTPQGEGISTTHLVWSDDDAASWTSLHIDYNGTEGRTLSAVAPTGDGNAIVTFFRNAPGGERGGLARHFAVAVKDGVASDSILLDATNEWPSDTVGDYVGLAGLPDGAFSVWATAADRQSHLVGARITFAEA